MKKRLRNTIEKKIAPEASHRLRALVKKVCLFFCNAEVLIVLALFIGSGIFRFYNFRNLGLTHFDEGIYASLGRILIKEPDSFYKSCLNQAVFAPPLYPYLCGICFKHFGARDFISIVPSILSGILTCIVVFELGRIIDDIKTGLWAALFLMTNEFHIVYSRLALTDALFTLFFTLTVLLGVIAWKKNKWWCYIFPGISAGLAMNTKYSGFIPLVLVYGYWACLFLIEEFPLPLLRKDERRNGKYVILKRLLPLVIGVLGSAFLFILIYRPWYINVDKFMGYENLIKHHKGYGYSVKEAIKAFKKNPGEMLFYLKEWSTLVFYLLPLGFLLSFWKWRKGFIIIYAWLIFFYFGLFLYLRYTRLALPLIPAACLLAAVFVSRIFAILDLILPRHGKIKGLVHAGIALLFIVISFKQRYPLLSLNTTSYRDTREYIKNPDLPSAIVFKDTLGCFNFYSEGNWISLVPHPKIRKILEMEVKKYFILDEHITWNTQRNDFFERNKDKLKILTTIPRNRYATIWSEPFSRSEYLQMKSHPENFNWDFSIYIFETREPCVIPPSWGNK
jgi:hypothetical protein